MKNLLKYDIIIKYFIWGCSSPGRAIRSQRIGSQFESDHLHHNRGIRTLSGVRISLVSFHQCRQSLNTTKTEYIFVNGVAGFVAYK